MVWKMIKKLSFYVKFGYGSAEGANSLMWTLFYLFYMYYLTDVAMINPSFAGLILMIGTVADAILGLLIGRISDGINTRWGRRRPILFAVAIPYGFAAWLLFTSFDMFAGYTGYYFIGVVLIFFLCFSILDNTQGSLAAEITNDYDERTSLVGFRTGWSQIFSIIAAGLPLIIVGMLKDYGYDQKTSWSIMACIFGATSIPLIILTWRATKGYELIPEINKISFITALKDVYKNKSFWFTAGLYGFGWAGMNIASSSIIYIMKYYLGLNENESSLSYSIFFLSSVFWIPIINYISKKFEKRYAFISFVCSWGVIQMLGIFILQPGDKYLFYLFCFLISAGNTALLVLAWSMIPDLVEVDEFKTGQRKEGLYIGFSSTIMKIIVGLTLWAFGHAISLTGYIPDSVQSQKTLLGIRLIFGIGTMFFLFISAIFCYFLPLNRSRHTALQKAIDQKKKGLDWDRNVLNGLYF